MKLITAYIFDDNTGRVISEMYRVPLHTAIEGMQNEAFDERAGRNRTWTGPHGELHSMDASYCFACKTLPCCSSQFWCPPFKEPSPALMEALDLLGAEMRRHLDQSGDEIIARYDWRTIGFRPYIYDTTPWDSAG